MIVSATQLAYVTIHAKRISQMKQKQFDEFRAAIVPILNADKRFNSVACGEFTGYPHGSLVGAVASSDDLAELRKKYLEILTNHPASVGFEVKLDERIKD